jgi:hypothetical protein
MGLNTNSYPYIHVYKGINKQVHIDAPAPTAPRSPPAAPASPAPACVHGQIYGGTKGQ